MINANAQILENTVTEIISESPRNDWGLCITFITENKDTLSLEATHKLVSWKTSTKAHLKAVPVRGSSS